MVKTRTKYIGIGTTILSIGLLLGWFINSDNFDVEVSGDITCATSCTSFFNITSKYYNYYLYNKEGIKLDFIPEIKDYAICKPDKRCKSCGGCPAGWREIDFTTPYTSRYKYVYKFYKGKKETFMIIGTKQTEQTVKWGLNAINVYEDPIWHGINITELCDWKINREDVYGNCIYYTNSTFCIDEPSNLTCDIITKSSTYRCKVGEREVRTCANVIGYQINNKKISFSECGINCKRNKNIISCDMCAGEDGVVDANCDGILQSGESGFKVDISKLNWNNLKIKADSVKFTKLRDCVVK